MPCVKESVGPDVRLYDGAPERAPRSRAASQQQPRSLPARARCPFYFLVCRLLKPRSPRVLCVPGFAFVKGRAGGQGARPPRPPSPRPRRRRRRPALPRWTARRCSRRGAAVSRARGRARKPSSRRSWPSGAPPCCGPNRVRPVCPWRALPLRLRPLRPCNNGVGVCYLVGVVRACVCVVGAVHTGGRCGLCGRCRPRGEPGAPVPRPRPCSAELGAEADQNLRVTAAPATKGLGQAGVGACVRACEARVSRAFPARGPRVSCACAATAWCAHEPRRLLQRPARPPSHNARACRLLHPSACVACWRRRRPCRKQ